MSTHAREYWLNVQAREAARIAMDIEVDQEEIDLTFETSFAGDGAPVNAAVVRHELRSARHIAAYHLAMAEQLHRLLVGMEGV